MTGEEKEEDKELLEWMTEIYGAEEGEQRLLMYAHTIVYGRIFAIDSFEIQIIVDKDVILKAHADTAHRYKKILRDVLRGRCYKTFLFRLEPQIEIIGMRPWP